MDVHKAGGGINFTVDHTRQAEEDHLYISLRQRLSRMLRAGTTLVECKSGYGLEVETEMKMLRVIERARKELPIGISATFLGAHSVPKYVFLMSSSRFSYHFSRWVILQRRTQRPVRSQVGLYTSLYLSYTMLVCSKIDIVCNRRVCFEMTSSILIMGPRRCGLSEQHQKSPIKSVEGRKLRDNSAYMVRCSNFTGKSGNF